MVASNKSDKDQTRTPPICLCTSIIWTLVHRTQHDCRSFRFTSRDFKNMRPLGFFHLDLSKCGQQSSTLANISVVSICLQLVSSNCDLSNDTGGFPIAVTEILVILWIRIDWGIRCCICKVENDVERIRIETSIQLPLTHKSPNGTHFAVHYTNPQYWRILCNEDTTVAI